MHLIKELIEDRVFECSVIRTYGLFVGIEKHLNRTLKETSTDKQCRKAYIDYLSDYGFRARYVE